MRLVLDLIGAQTERSSVRGIGRYTRELSFALAIHTRPGVTLRYMLSANFPERADDIRKRLAPHIAPEAISLYRTPIAPADTLPQSAPARRIAEAIVRRHVAGLRPDVLLATSLYEPYEPDFSYFDLTRQPAGLAACIAYDFIPLIYRKDYLRHARYRRFYEEQTAVTASADILFAISEQSRQDAIAFLDIEPDRVVNIGAAADSQFHPRAFSPDERKERERRLGVRSPFVFCAAGVDARKNSDVVLDAFVQLDAEARRGAQLVMLVPYSPEKKGALQASATAAGLPRDDIVFLDRITDDDLAFLYQTAEVFVFPSLYEGFGLPLLEAMQSGGAVIAGDNSSLREIADRADVRCDTRSVSAVADLIARALRDADWREDVRSWGLRRAADFSWRATAQRLQDALLDRSPGIVRASRRGRETPASLGLRESLDAEIADIFRADPRAGVTPADAEACAQESAPWLYEPSRRRILIDVTQIVARDAGTGIQRVVRNIVRALYRTKMDATPVAVRLQDGRLVACQSFAAALLDAQKTVSDAPIDTAAGDILLMLDNSWERYGDFAPMFEAIQQAGGEVVTCLYDLIPERYRAASIDPVPRIFSAWLRDALIRSDAIVAISQSVAAELVELVETQRLPHRSGLKIGWFQLGDDLEANAVASRAPTGALARTFAAQEPVFLVVGTVEPRKGHRVALDAFERLWKRDLRARLVFIGRKGWNVEALADRLLRHPQFGRSLFWHQDASDGDLAYAYRACTALVFPSYVEGYGLPLVEAAQAGKPVLCSDIPVFREVGADGAVYFRVNDADSLAAAVADFLDGKRRADPSRINRLSWDESAVRLADLLLHDRWPLRLA